MTNRIYHWWNRLTPKWKAALTRFGPLLATALLICTVWVYLNLHGSWITSDRMLLKLIGVASAYGALVSVLGARRWSLINLGLLAYLIADALMLLRLFAQVGPQPVSTTELNLIRAFFSVGCAAILISLTAWMIQTRGGTVSKATRLPSSGPGVQAEQPEILS